MRKKASVMYLALTEAIDNCNKRLTQLLSFKLPIVIPTAKLKFKVIVFDETPENR